MTSNRRGFSRERHTELKLLIAALATSGFALTWFGFARAHDPAIEAVSAAALREETPSPPATNTAVAPPTAAAATAGATVAPTSNTPALPTTVSPVPTRTSAPGTPVPAQPSPTATVVGTPPKPRLTPTTKKKSRGS